MARVVNLSKSAYTVYIGRGSAFGNPFKLAIYGRKTCIAKYREYFYDRINTEKSFKGKVEALRGEVLGCYCKPLDCHGDVIVEYLNGTESK